MISDQCFAAIRKSTKCGQEITEAMGVFASHRGLTLSPWWHKMRIWRIYESINGMNPSKFIQVIYYDHPDGPYLSILASLTDRTPVCAKATRVPIRDFFQDEHFSSEALTIALQTAWNQAEKLATIRHEIARMDVRKDYRS
jgi:hypothetical protein